MAVTGAVDQRNAGDVVVGLFRSRGEAEAALSALRDAGFSGNSVSILTQNPDATLPDAEQSPPDDGEVAAAGAVTGGLVGGLAGWLLGVGALIIPGVGPFLAAGALATTLAGAAVGAGIGAITGTLSGMGVPEEEAHWYAQQVRAGGTLVTVRSEERASEARRLLREHGATDIERRDPEDVGYGVAGGSESREVTGSPTDTTNP